MKRTIPSSFPKRELLYEPTIPRAAPASGAHERRPRTAPVQGPSCARLFEPSARVRFWLRARVSATAADARAGLLRNSRQAAREPAIARSEQQPAKAAPRWPGHEAIGARNSGCQPPSERVHRTGRIMAMCCWAVVNMPPSSSLPQPGGQMTPRRSKTCVLFSKASLSNHAACRTRPHTSWNTLACGSTELGVPQGPSRHAAALSDAAAKRNIKTFWTPSATCGSRQDRAPLAGPLGETQGERGDGPRTRELAREVRTRSESPWRAQSNWLKRRIRRGRGCVRGMVPVRLSHKAVQPDGKMGANK